MCFICQIVTCFFPKCACLVQALPPLVAARSHEGPVTVSLCYICQPVGFWSRETPAFNLVAEESKIYFTYKTQKKQNQSYKLLKNQEMCLDLMDIFCMFRHKKTNSK